MESGKSFHSQFLLLAEEVTCHLAGLIMPVHHGNSPLWPRCQRCSNLFFLIFLGSLLAIFFIYIFIGLLNYKLTTSKNHESSSNTFLPAECAFYNPKPCDFVLFTCLSCSFYNLQQWSKCCMQSFFSPIHWFIYWSVSTNTVRWFFSVCFFVSK